MESLLKDSSNLEKLAYVAFGAALFSMQVADLYLNLWPDVKRLVASSASFFASIVHGISEFYVRLCKTIRDFSSGRYYKPWRDGNVVVITDLDHIRELSDAVQLSQRAVYSDIFGFQYTMSHLNTGLDPNEQVPHRYKLFGTAIRTIGVAQLSALHPYLQAHIDRTTSHWIDSQPRNRDGWQSVQLAPLMRNLATGMLGTYFFGEQMYQEPEFHQATETFYHDVIRCMAGLQLLPSFAKGAGYRWLTNNGYAIKLLFKRLGRAIDDKHGWREDENLKSLTLLNHLVEQTRGSDYWTTDMLIQAVIGIWFAASHQPWINLHFVMLELCERSEYVDALREEIREQQSLDMESIGQMKVLDSFVKECVRLNPLDRMAIRRKALTPYTFKNGPSVPQGGIACVSAWDIMHDPRRYPKPDEFDGYRFIGSRAGIDTRGTSFTDASKEFPVWGFGARVCPGRWHADLVLKSALVHMLAAYDFRLERPGDRHRWWWETFQMPYERSRVLFRRREKPIVPLGS